MERNGPYQKVPTDFHYEGGRVPRHERAPYADNPSYNDMEMMVGLRLHLNFTLHLRFSCLVFAGKTIFRSN